MLLLNCPNCKKDFDPNKNIEEWFDHQGSGIGDGVIYERWIFLCPHCRHFINVTLKFHATLENMKVHEVYSADEEVGGDDEDEEE